MVFLLTMIKKTLRSLLAFHGSSETIDLRYKLSKKDKRLIDGKLKEDLYSNLDLKYQIRPEVSPIDYYRLHEMDFNWIILDPMSGMVSEYAEKTQANLPESIKVISPEQKLLYFWWYLDGQVTNGGFSQFIYNGYDTYFPTILNGLKLLPDKKYYELVEKVYLYYLKQGMDFIDRSKIDYFKDKFYDNKFLSDASSEYFRINDQLYKDVETFIRDNQNQFIQPIAKNYTGMVEHKTDNVSEFLEVQGGIPEGNYTRYIDNIKVNEIFYSHGKKLVEKKFRDGELYEENKDDDTIKNLVHVLEYYPNGILKLHQKKIIKDKHNSDLIYRERYYDNGIIKAQFWVDDTQKKHIKRYFTDGQIRSYHTFRPLGDGSLNNLTEYILCFDENRNETLINGDGIFYDYDFPEDSLYGFFKYVANCKNYLAEGETTGYRNGKLASRHSYVNGLQHGSQIDYDEDGNQKHVREFRNGKFIEGIRN